MSISEHHPRIRASDRRERGRIGASRKGLQDPFLLAESEMVRINTRDVLRDVLDDQMSLMASGRFNKFRGQADTDFLNVFSLDPLFLELYSEAQAMAFRCEDSDIGFQKRLKGAIFEKIAYAFLSSSDIDSGIPIMGDGVIKISKVMNPKREVEDFGFGQVGINGIYVPDGYVVNALGGEPKIVGVLECKLGYWQKKAIEQESRAGHELRRMGSIVDPNPYFMIVSPDFGAHVEAPRGAEMKNLPVKMDILEQEFFDMVYYQQRGKGGITLAEIREKRVAYGATSCQILRGNIK